MDQQRHTFDGDLSQYAAVMFLNTPSEELTPAQPSRFEAYMRSGGNAMVVHRAAITHPNAWTWYEKLVGRTIGGCRQRLSRDLWYS